MTTQTGPITWTPNQGGAKGSLIATVYLDSSIDSDYSVPIVGQYITNAVTADGVIVGNTGAANTGTVSISSGTLQTTIPPFVRDTITLGGSVGTTLEVQVTAGVVQLLFYKGTPPIGAQLVNYAGASALSNIVIFNGGVTTGTADAQAISVATNYAFSNGVLVTGTAGFTNGGPATINVNMVGAVPITKISALGPIALDGGEIVAGSSFILEVNAANGTFDLVSDISGSDTVPTIIIGASGNFNPPATGDYEITMTGGGGGGGTGNGNGSGGGAAATAIAVISMIKGTPVPVVVGLGGAADTNGGDTSIAGLVAGLGFAGNGGDGAGNNFGGAGGTTAGAVSLPVIGGDGINSIPGTNWGGGGGASFWGGGGRGGVNASPGQLGRAWGSGGGGGAGVGQAGGAGGHGIIVARFLG